ncbi:MAG TPA: PBP1A family penicillin-binding protein [Pyrinomonadaceae bacterium]|nr:PBP1A family penicillin-binding protein [Pyrinomonadaceae bacterium]
MPIEITSLPDRGRALSFHKLARAFRQFFSHDSASPRRVVLRSVFTVLSVALIVGGDSLLRSYKYYSRLIDARLAKGYLTSRPGLYAAPRIIQPGQKLSRAELKLALRRAGYVESQGSSVWSGSFREDDATLEIRSHHPGDDLSPVVVVEFDQKDRIAGITSNSLPLETFTIGTEVLSNDISYKTSRRETLPFTDIPPFLIQAILAIEDQRFFQHRGLDVRALGRAVVRNVSNEQLEQGGSTITQQLVKNTYLSPERTFRRKYAEAMLAFALEQRLSKQDIFALYCNEVYLGQRGAVAVRGVKEAARIYFGKELKSLTLTEAATIAGMIQGPARFSPEHHVDAARARRNIVLEAMLRNGSLSEQQALGAASEPLTLAPRSNTNKSLAPYFVDYVNRLSNASSVRDSERQIYTTIDLDLQQLAEVALKRQLDRLDTRYRNRNSKPQAALVALDPHTGNVLAMVGGRDYAESQLNRAVDARRQPGSTFKPFVYAAAIEDGMSPVRLFADEPREFAYDRNRIYRPANYGGGYSMREVTMRTGLVKSLNVVTVDVALQTGLARIANLSSEFGLPRPERYPALALGTEEVTPLELAAAYSAFVNGGRRVEPKVIASVSEQPATHSIGEAGAGPQVISPSTAYMITNMLAAVVDHGTARAARDVAKKTAVAGKTGTSRDGWFVGYTPNLVCVVWIGFDDNLQLGLTGAEAALPAWAEFIEGAVALKPALGGRNFECPEGIRFVEIDVELGSLSTLSCPHRELIAVTDRLAPNVECFTHGNLPASVEMNDGKVVLRDGPKEPFLAQHYRPRRLIANLASSSLMHTRVDIDRRGKQTLVNSMR